MNNITKNLTTLSLSNKNKSKKKKYKKWIRLLNIIKFKLLLKTIYYINCYYIDYCEQKYNIIIK